MTQEELNLLVREEKAKYLREWRRKNPDKVKKANRKYWERKALKAAAEMEEKNAAEN